MHRRILILRRFGDLSFGLGFYEGGVWVDHASADAGRIDSGATPIERAALEAIHAWFDCCRGDQDVAAGGAAEGDAAGSGDAVVFAGASLRT